MDIIILLDKLDSEAKTAKRLPGTVMPLIKQLRAALDEKAHSDEKLELDRQREATRAREQAERLLTQAREQMEKLTDDQDVIVLAKARAEQIESEAVDAAEGIRKGADEYAFEVLCQLEQELTRSLSVITNGLRTLQDRRDGAAAEADATETNYEDTEISGKQE
ncbi:MAG: hypothetical protein E3J64_07815 [Anaerolineales bacterium]|nr:MAG: hypothetical protein E3J64_07815 [Anaerolineales bacterium]